MESMDSESSVQSPDKPTGPTEGRYSNSLNRSCEGCRGRKIRCQPVEGTTSGKCARCEKLKLSCIYLAPQQKRRRKRTDVRVAELEKELRTLRHRFEGRRDTSESSSASPGDAVEGPGIEQFPPQDLSFSHKASSAHEEPNPISPIFDDDEIESDYVDEATAELLFTKFKVDLHPHFPFIGLEDEITARMLKDTRPILHSAILAVAAESLYPPLGEALFHRMERLYAQHVFMDGHKSLELVQSLLVSALWYHPPDKFANLKFTTYSHLAGNMALDIRLGKQQSADKMSHGFLERDDSFDKIDAHRTLVACYIVCSNLGFSFRRPRMFEYSIWVENCIKTLESSPHAADMMMSAWSRLQRIAEEAVVALELNTSVIDLQDIKTQSMLKAYDRQLELWKLKYWDTISTSLKIHYFYIRASLHELSMYKEYAQDEFEPPYLMRPKPLPSDISTELIPAFVTSIITVCECTGSILDLFATFDTINLRSIYVILHTRALYAIIVLTKLMICINAPESSIGKILNSSMIKLTERVHRMLTSYRAAAGAEPFHVPVTFLSIITKVAAWYHRQGSQTGKKPKTDEILEPLKWLSTKEREDGLNSVQVPELPKPAANTTDLSSAQQGMNNQNQANDASQGISQQPIFGTPQYQFSAPINEQSPIGGLQPMSGLAWTMDQGANPNGNVFPQSSAQPSGLNSNPNLFSDFSNFDQMWNSGLFEDSSMLMFAPDGMGTGNTGGMNQANGMPDFGTGP